MVSRHYRLPDGSWQAVIFSGPRHYMDDSGRWVDIDRRLLQVGPGVYQNLANPLKSRFDSRGIQVFTRDNAGFRCVPLGMYSVSGAGVRLRLGGSQTAPKPGAESVEYAGSWGDGSRTVYQVLNGCLKERIILGERPDLGGMEDPVYVEFVTKLENLGGLTLLAGSHPVDEKKTHEGSLSAMDEHGKFVFRLPRPVAWEGDTCDPDPSATVPLAYAVEASDGGYRLAVRVPAGWLLDEGRTYPVTIDPTFNQNPAAAFGWMNPTHPTIPWVNGNGFTGIGTNGTYRSWYKWDITSIPDASNISQVELRTYCDSTTSASTSATITVYDYVGSNFGPYSAYFAAEFNDFGSGNAYTTFSVTATGFYPTSSTRYQFSAQANSDLQGRLAGNQFQVGFDLTGATVYKRFGGSGGTNIHDLLVTYNTGPPAPAWINYPGTSSGGNYTVSWATTTGTGSVTYDLEEDNNAGFTSPTNVYSGAATSFNVTNHPPGTFYYRVRGVDSIGPGAWCTGGPIVITVPPPPPPASITVPATSATGSFTVQWTASAGATQYELQEANNSSFAGATQVYLGANLSFGVTGKTGGTWWYQVRAINAGGNSAWTQSTNGCQIVAPTPPASITVPATSASGNFTVSWTASAGAT
ncbi:MAG: fibronectin type III domain-containing protein, partial [Planctomycetota bacterium]